MPSPAARCDRWWTGIGAGHCSACHETFTGIEAFDKHRNGSHAAGTRHCVDPASVGLVPANRAWPGWTVPHTEEETLAYARRFKRDDDTDDSDQDVSGARTERA